MSSQFLAIIALVAVAIVPSFAHGKSASSIVSPALLKSKEDRLADAVEKLTGPANSIYAGDLVSGESQFGALLAEMRHKHGETSIKAADLIYMFSLIVSIAAIMSADERLKGMEISYGAAAVAAYRAASGPTSLDVAEAIQSQASTLAKSDLNNPPVASDELLKEALQMRRQTLGANDPGARQIMSLLANRNGLPARTGRDPNRIAAVAAEFEKLIAISPVVSYGNISDSAAAVRFELAEMYARNGLFDQAVAEAVTARKIILSWPEKYLCGSIEILTAAVEPALREGGDTKASITKKRIISASPSPCAADTIP